MGGSSATLSIVLKLVDDASSAMQGVGSSLKSVGESMTSAGKTLTTDVTLPIVGVGVAAAKMASDFQSSMTMLVTQAGLPADQLKGLTAQVLAFAQSGAQQAPEELAQGLYHIVSLGVPAANAMGVLKLASEGAAMSGADLEDVANALGAAVASNIKGSGDYEQTMAILNATVGAGNMRMQDLATSLGNVLPQATTAGLGLEDVGAAMATMTDNGMPAADAATRLHMAIALMSAPTGAAQKALEGIGVTQFQLADDMRNKGLLPALQDLHDHLVDSGKTADEQSAVLSAAFGGGRSAGAIELLLNNLDRVQQKYDLIDQGVGKFGADVALQSQTAAAQFAEAQAQMSDALIQIGAAILPIVTTMLPKLVGLVTDAVNWFESLSPRMQDTVLAAFGLAAALGPVLIVLGSLFTVAGSVATAFGLVWPAVMATGTAIGLVGAPVLLVIAAVALLAAVIYLHWNDIVGWTSDMMLKVATAWNAGWAAVEAYLKAAWSSIRSAFETALSAIENAVTAAFTAIENALYAAFLVIENLVTTYVDLMVGIVILGLDWLDPQWRQHWQALVDFFVSAWNAIKAFLESAWNAIRTFVVSAVAQTVTAIKGPVTELAAWWQGVWQSFSDVFAKAWTGIESFASASINAIIGFFDKLGSAVAGVMSKITAPLQAVGSFLSSASGALGGAFGAAAGAAGSVLGAANSAVGGAFNTAVGTGGQATGLNTYAYPFAKGGIVTGPTFALVGEAGPEAIIPLSAFAGGSSLAGAAGGSAGGVVIQIMGGNYLDSGGATMIANAIGKQLLQQLKLKNYS